MQLGEFDTRVGAYALIFDGESVLLSWWNGESRPQLASWTLPGGGVEFGEQLEGAAIREVFEETGYRIELEDYLTSGSFAMTGDGLRRPLHRVRVVFTARIVGGRLGTIEVGGSTDRAAWIPLAELDQAGPRLDLVDMALDAWRRRR